MIWWDRHSCLSAQTEEMSMPLGGLLSGEISPETFKRLFTFRSPSPILTRRKPRFVLRLSGVVLLRLAPRTFGAMLFQLPPRITRFDLPSIRRRFPNS
jgi:hypothetical protein